MMHVRNSLISGIIAVTGSYAYSTMALPEWMAATLLCLNLMAWGILCAMLDDRGSLDG